MDSFLTWLSFLKSEEIVQEPTISSWEILLIADSIVSKHFYYFSHLKLDTQKGLHSSEEIMKAAKSHKFTDSMMNVSESTAL